MSAPGDWEVVEEALRGRMPLDQAWHLPLECLARLREREKVEAGKLSATIRRAEAAEARVAELEAKFQEVEHPFDHSEYAAMVARVARLEEALAAIIEEFRNATMPSGYEEDDEVVIIARAALSEEPGT